MLGLNFLRFLSYSAKPNEPLDLRQVYAGAQVLDSGQNPYSDSLLKHQWKTNFTEEQLQGLPLPGAPENFLVYPPPVIASLIPLSRTNWFDARTVVWSLCFLLIVLSGIFASRNFLPGTVVLGALFLLSFKGTYTALILGQHLLFSLLLILLHLYSESKDRRLWSGFFLACAFLKPSLALPLVFFLIAEKKFKTLLYTALFSVLILSTLLLFFGTDSVFFQFSGWFQNMKAQMDVVYNPGHEFLRNNLTSLSSWIYSLSGINLHFMDTPLLLISSLLVIGLRFIRRVSSLQTLTLLITLSFLFSYHLYYDLLLFLCLLRFVDLSTLPAKFLLPFLVLYLPFGYLLPSFNFHPPILLVLVFLVFYRLPLSRETA